jgi:regulator of sigma E protease
MDSIQNMLGTAFDLLVVIVGFGLIIFIHELGHFVAAKWAGIRVMAFAIGFGPAVCSYRKGFGLRRGSSERKYLKQMRENPPSSGDTAPSPTEYRLNALPFGGYVKMLGQDDMDPTAVSNEPDSYQNCPPLKRMVVISAGVVANVALAVVLFIVVFMAGMRVEPAAIGSTMPGSPASRAVPVNAEQAGVVEAGLKDGDVVVKINGRRPNSFNDLAMATAMAKRDTPVRLLVERPGVTQPIEFSIEPEPDRMTKLLDIGILPPRSATLLEADSPEAAQQFQDMLAQMGLAGVEPGMTLVSAGERAVDSFYDLARVVDASGGKPIPVVFEDDGRRVEGELTPIPKLQRDLVEMPGDSLAEITHLLGLQPVMRVADASPRATKFGLQDNDVFIKVGSVMYPSIDRGIAEIRASAGESIPLVVQRETDTGTQQVELSARVSSKGMIGFGATDTGTDSTLLSLPPERITAMEPGAEPRTPPAFGLITTPGTRIMAVNETQVSNFAELREALQQATGQRADDGSATVELTIEPPDSDVKKVSWTIPAGAIDRLHALGWASPLGDHLFQPVLTTLKADGPLDAVRMGVTETNRVMVTVYATLVRLFQGSVKVEHLKGPVGIAHIGTRIVNRGLLWLLFFMALISVNLAVINFLPLPIVDGGLFIFLLIEQVRGKPVPAAIQNATTLAGLVLIGSLFLIVTFNDILALFGG